MEVFSSDRGKEEEQEEEEEEGKGEEEKWQRMFSGVLHVFTNCRILTTTLRVTELLSLRTRKILSQG